MLDRVRAFTEKYQMIRPGDRIVAGISGGADSVCLLFLLKELCGEKGAALFAVHVNHCLRGAEADGDEAYVRELCGSLEVPLSVCSFDVQDRAKREHLTLEEAGRLCRYEAFAEEAERLGGARIAVAHHAGDQAETVLFQLFRGSGLKGLSGMSPARDNIIRPLLCAEREEIETWLTGRGIAWRTDSTNLSMDYTRNRIRGDILKTARESVNAKAIRHVAEAAAELGEVEAFLERKTAEAYRICVREEDGARFVFTNAFSMQDPLIGSRLLRRCMAELGGLKDVERVHIEMLRELFEKQTGSRMDLPGDRSARREYEGVRLSRSEKPARQQDGEKTSPISFCPEIPGSVTIRGQKWKFTLYPEEKIEIIPQKTYTKWFDYDIINNTVEIRHRQAGDVLAINKNGGTQRLKKYFINEKISQEEREKVWLVADGHDIMWVVGHRQSQRYQITESTKKILEIHFCKGENYGRDSKSIS